MAFHVAECLACPLRTPLRTPLLFKDNTLNYIDLEPCAGCAASPTIICERRRRFLMVGARLPPICRRVADASLMGFIALLHFSCFA